MLLGVEKLEKPRFFFNTTSERDSDIKTILLLCLELIYIILVVFPTMSSPQQRLSSVANQLAAPGSARQKILAKNPDDVVCR